MFEKQGETPRRKSAWERFSIRYMERIQKTLVEFEPTRFRYNQEKDEEKKERLKLSYARKTAPIIMIAFLDELSSTSKREFDQMMSEVSKKIDETLVRIARDVLDFELMTKDPIAFFQETFLALRIGPSVERELRKHEHLYRDPELLLRVIAFSSIREFAYLASLLEIRTFFEVLKIGRARLGIDENWAIATFSLNLEESLIKKKLEELGEPQSETRKSFHDLLIDAIRIIEKKETRRLPSDIFLSDGYRNLRNKLDHEGFSWKPTAREANEIVAHLVRLANALWVSQPVV